MHRLLISLLTVGAITPSHADCLTEVAVFAKEICGELKTRGSSSLLEANGELKADVSGMVSRIVGSGSGSLDGKALSDAYENVLRGDLAAELSDNRKCRQEMAKAAITRVCNVSTSSKAQVAK